MTTTTSGENRILRYRLGQRIVHALLAGSFLLLLATGLAFLWSAGSLLAPTGTTRMLHRIGAGLFMAVPLVYLLVDRRGALELLRDSFHFDRDDIAWFKASYRYFLGYAVEMPPQGRLNAGQKVHHAAVILFSGTIVASGLLLWLAKGSLQPNGLALAAMVHDLSMLVLSVLLAGHLYFTVVYRALPAMVSGYISRDAARLEHAKWLIALEHHASPTSRARRSAGQAPPDVDQQVEASPQVALASWNHKFSYRSSMIEGD